ncbi:putative N-terminal methionine N(alpha)-acetyltransferase NatE [Microsporum audouinii]
MSRLFSASKSSRSSSLPTTNPAASGQHTAGRADRADRRDLKPTLKSALPPMHPNTVIPPPPICSTPAKSNPAFQNLTPYPHVAPSISTPHPHVTISQVKTAHVPSLMRITGLLLPVRYQNSFYTATITDPFISSVSRVALYHQHPLTNIYGAAHITAKGLSSSPSSPVSGTDKVIGGIRCRLEPATLPHPSSTKATALRPVVNLYIQTLHLLSPYRGNGIAASLLNSLIYAEDSGSSKDMSQSNGGRRESSRRVSNMVKHYNIRTVTAHVHETNEDALSWYAARGFTVEDNVLEGYYRRLTPGGARVVKLELNWDEEGSTDEHDSNTCNEDDDWEKVEVHDIGTGEKIDDYQQVSRSSIDEAEARQENAKRVRRG